jgi:hypothetical protein
MPVSVQTSVQQRPIKPAALWRLSLLLLLCASALPRARAEATLFLEEPYSYDGALAGTGHAAVYLDRVCAETPVRLRLCRPDETGVVLSRYHRVAGYDWIAIPLVPYLYAVEKDEDIPLFADKKMVAFLRDRYRRTYLETLIPDLPDGGTPPGDWYELVGASYLRTIYAYQIETNDALDAALIRKLNSGPNHDRFNIVTANCSDFARMIIDFYHPRAVHRSIVGDLGVTTPKQLARTLSKYSRHHPEFHSSSFAIAQIPGTTPRSKPVHGVTECGLTAQKYMLPLFALHPYVAGALIAGYIGHGRFDPSKNALILNASDDLDVPPTRADRRNYQSRLQELMQSATSLTSVSSNLATTERHWESRLAAAEPAIDATGKPAIQVSIDGEIKGVGATRANILDSTTDPEFAIGLIEARLREELKPAIVRKTARSDVENDLQLLERLLAQHARELTSAAAAASAASNTAEPLPSNESTAQSNPLP